MHSVFLLDTGKNIDKGIPLDWDDNIILSVQEHQLGIKEIEIGLVEESYDIAEVLWKLHPETWEANNWNTGQFEVIAKEEGKRDYQYAVKTPFMMHVKLTEIMVCYFSQLQFKVTRGSTQEGFVAIDDIFLRNEVRECETLPPEAAPPVETTTAAWIPSTTFTEPPDGQFLTCN